MKKIIFVFMMMAGIAIAKDKLWYGSTNAVAITNAMVWLNNSSFLPAPGVKNGKVIPNQTTSWCDSVSHTTNGWYCIPKIPEKRLDALGVPGAMRAAFIQSFGITVLTNPVIVVEDKENEE